MRFSYVYKILFLVYLFFLQPVVDTQWFTEKKLANISLGSLLIIIILRTIQYNMAKMRVSNSGESLQKNTCHRCKKNPPVRSRENCPSYMKMSVAMLQTMLVMKRFICSSMGHLLWIATQILTFKQLVVLQWIHSQTLLLEIMLVCL